MDLTSLEREALDALDQAPTRAELESVYAKYLGRKDGELTKVLRSLGTLSADERKTVAPNANQLRTRLEEKFSDRQRTIESAELTQKLSSDKQDLTLPGRTRGHGASHPIVTAIRDICGIFETLGYVAVGGPEVETDFNNFTALNIPEDHPARDLHDTFYINAKKDSQPYLLRTHTSPIQIRFAQKHKPPIRIVGPGRVFRHEAEDATHAAIFHQVEGLAISETTSFADLKSTLLHFAKAYFGADQKIRLRPGYFPFVEPGAEVDILCFICHGTRAGADGGPCSLCKATGWIEMLGAGMVHPQVLKNVGYNPDKVQGFAFGMGVERIVMARYGIRDIRYFHSGDLRFLEQFR
jgi:phenylalanyl-tRNA synthetase alpha chain